MLSCSVVIPTHDRPDTLPLAVRSAARQVPPPLEIVVVDDASEPAADAAALHRVAGDVPVRVVRREEPGGASVARNTGLQAAAGEWVAFLDDDDLFLPGKLAAVADLLDQEPDTDLVYHQALIKMVKEGVSYRTAPKDLTGAGDPFRDLLVGNYVGGTPMVVVRRSAALAAGGFDPALLSQEDYDLWLRMAREGARFRYLPLALTACRYVTSGGGLSTDTGTHLDSVTVIDEKYALEYRAMDPAQMRAHRVWVLNAGTHRALMAGDAALARRLQWQVFRLAPSVSNLLQAAVTMLGPRAAFHLRARLRRGPASARATGGSR